jgi:hypothetical protein
MSKVPDEILALLSDPYIFSGNAEVTTKEILKRFQDRRGQVVVTDFVEAPHNRADLSYRPPPRRVETDPAVWQGEAATVRPVQEALPMGHAHSSQGTPSQKPWKTPEGHGSPYSNQFNHSDSQLANPEHSQRREWRNSAWGRQGSGLGVGGNT